MSQRVTVNIDPHGIADVRLNRPDKLNALDLAMFEGLAAAGDRLAKDGALRAVVLSGEGRAFCAGLDFASFMAAPHDGDGTRARGLLDRVEGSIANLAQYVAYVWMRVPVPVIAAVHGVAFGGGLQIALGADIRVAARDARLSVMEIKWGLIPDMTGTQTLRHLVRLDVAKELTFSGRIVAGDEAAALGLVTRLSEHPHDAAMTLARDIAGKSPDAIRAAKKLLNEAVDSSFADGLRREEALQRSLLGSPNQLEAVRANLEKRDPSFTDADTERSGSR